MPTAMPAALIPLPPITMPTTDASLIAPDRTMRGLPYMPLYLDRLQDSETWLRARALPELGFYLLNLWMAAWRATPAGSLQDSDAVLSAKAMCEPERWAEVRAVLLRGWTRGADGRLYHRVICEVAAEVWEGRSRFRESQAAGRAAKAAKARKQGRVAQGDFHLTSPESPTESGVEHAVEHAEARPESVERSVERVATHQSAPQRAVDSGTESFPVEPGKADNALDSLDLADANEDLSRDSNPRLDFKCEVESVKKGGEPPLPPRPSKGGTMLNDSFYPNQTGTTLVAKLCLDLDDEVAAFRDYFNQATGTRAFSRDWQATFRQWCRKSARLAPKPWLRAMSPERPGRCDWMLPTMAARARTFGRERPAPYEPEIRSAA